MNVTKPQHRDEITPQEDREGSLPPKQELALQAVISHTPLKESALAAGSSETTLWRYMQDEAFVRRLSEARRDAMSHALIRL